MENKKENGKGFIWKIRYWNAWKTRRSVRKYKKEQIAEEQLQAILKAGTYAPTGMGAQSPVMVVVQDPELIRKTFRLERGDYGNGFRSLLRSPYGNCSSGGQHQKIPILRTASLVMGNLMNAAHAGGSRFLLDPPGQRELLPEQRERLC